MEITNKETIMRQIIAKQDELLDLYSRYARIEEDDNWKDRYKDAELCKQLADLNEQLKQAETEAEVAEIKSVSIPVGWICPRCQKVHNWMVQHCDCPANVITASTTEPIPENYLSDCIEKATPNLSKIKDVDRELEEIRGEDKKCENCKYYPLWTTDHPCSICLGMNHSKWEPIK